MQRCGLLRHDAHTPDVLILTVGTPPVVDEQNTIPPHDEPLLNGLSWDLVQQVLTTLDELRVEPVTGFGSGLLLDFGVEALGSLAAGLALVEVCMAGLCDVQLSQRTLQGWGWPQITVQTDNPVEACLLSQYAGWRIRTDDYFAMASGPMRAAAGREPLFKRLEYREAAEVVVGILESSELPGEDVVRQIAHDCGVSPSHVALLVAPTSSLAGNLQVVARSVETAMHKLFEVGFDVTRVVSALGSAPVPPVADDDLIGIGRTNDAILYGAQVTLWCTGDDESLEELGPRIPSSGSAQHGRPFLDLFAEAGNDFYQLDPMLFSPAQVVMHNVETGRVHLFGTLNEELLAHSFGL